ncbi:MAG: type transport system permease protein [Clostridiales bacterium]|jgi:ABC-2 type transport system permease protein|nr:type transport system permease protein [Clostridiales bacterium]MDN5299074.1 type transport system permease protein [Clostridiales bacterium]
MGRIFRQAFLSYKAMYSYVNPTVFFLMMILNPTLQLAFFAFMVKFAYGSKDISPWIIGNAFLLASSNAIFIIGTLAVDERRAGTLMVVMGSPVNKFRLFISRSMFHIIDIGIRVVIGFMIGTLFFDFPISEISIFKLFLSIGSSMLSGLGFGLLIGSFALIITDMNMFLNTMEQVLILFTGAVFSVSKLPTELRWISEIVPLRRSIEASRLLLGIDQSNFYHLIGDEILISMIMMILGYIAFEICSYLARKNASIDLY